MNLLEETKKMLKDNHKTINDIKWIGTDKYYIDINEFLEKADVNYDDGYGAPEVATNLKIVGDDWWMERHEYDGSEWWEFKSMIKKPNKKLELKTLFAKSVGWETLEEANNVNWENE